MTGTPTPGEWKLRRVVYPGGEDVSFELRSGRQLVAQTIIREIGAEDSRIAQDEANMRLFAASKDLLAALKLLLADGGPLSDPVSRKHAGDTARAAIAKAEGRS